MGKQEKLIFIKIVHSIVWLFFNVVLGYLFYAVIANKIGKWVWIGLGLFLAEGIVLLLFKNFCPLTIIARKYSDSLKDNFDIYLPNWLAKYNKLIYTSLLGVVILILIYRLLQTN